MTKEELFCEYVKELKPFLPESDQKDPEFWKKGLKGYLGNPNVRWQGIYYNGEEVGFIIIGLKYPEKYSESDWSVCEAFVLPEYRKIGLMTKKMEELCRIYPGMCSLLILEGNTSAMKFWKHFFYRKGYYRKQLDEQEMFLAKGLVLQGWVRRVYLERIL